LDEDTIYAGLNSYGDIQSNGFAIVWLLTPTQMFLKNDTKAVSQSSKTSVGRMETFFELHIPYKNIQTVSRIDNFYSFDKPVLGEQLILISYTHADGQSEKVALYSPKAEEAIAVLQEHIRRNAPANSE